MFDEVDNSALPSEPVTEVASEPVEGFLPDLKPGRPRKANALSGTERARRSRARQKAYARQRLEAALKANPVTRPLTELEAAVQDPAIQKTKEQLLRDIESKMRQDRAERRATKKAAAEKKVYKEREAIEPTDKLESYDSTKELSKIPEIRAIHAVNGIATRNVQNQLAELAKLAAYGLNIPCNRYLIKHGVSITKQAIAEKKNIPALPVTNERAGGAEVLSRYELYRLWDMATLGGTHDFASTMCQTLDFDLWLACRNRFIKDSAYACMMTSHPIDPNFHTQILEFLPHFNFDGLYQENYTLIDAHTACAAQTLDSFKEFLLLVFRGAWKSTLVSIIASQLLCAMPDARIGLLAGDQDTAANLLKLMKTNFLRLEGNPLSDFQRLWPEMVVLGDPMSDSDLLCPARKHFQKEPSLWSKSPDSVTASLHVDMLVFDDVVESQGSGSEKTRVTLHSKLENLKNLLDGWGIGPIQAGTPWAVGDYWYKRLQIAEEDSAIKTMVLPAWTVKSGYNSVPLRERTLEMVDLSWPMKCGSPEASFQELKRKLISDEVTFRTQQLLEFVGDEEAIKIVFTEDGLRKRMIPAETLLEKHPQTMMVQAWDTAYRAENNRADRSAGVCGSVFLDEKGRSCLLIREIVVDRFAPSELGLQIAKFALRWLSHGLQVVSIEKINGFEWLLDKVKAAAIQLFFTLPHIYPRKPESGPKNKGIKGLRVKKLELLLDTGRLWFSTSMGNVDTTFQEFINFDSTTTKGRKMDIVDAISRASEYLGPDVGGEDLGEVAIKAQEALLLKRQHDMIFGSSDIYGPPPAAIESLDSDPTRFHCWPKRQPNQTIAPAFDYMKKKKIS